MSVTDIRCLGHDILWCADSDPSHPTLAGRVRFLDHLWLPSALTELTPEQIFVINRYRESVIGAEGRYIHARRAHHMLVNAIISVESTALIEIGCGKFPINAPCKRYLGIDIDTEAIAFVQSQGKNACEPAKLVTNAAGPTDCIVSAYAMHFAISDSLLRDLDRVASNDAIFCFNLIVEGSLATLDLLARLSPAWPLFQVVKTSCMARREFFFVAGRAYAGQRVFAAAQAIQRSDLDNLVQYRPS